MNDRAQKINGARRTGKSSIFEKISLKVTRAAGSTVAFTCAFGVIIAWLITGPIFGFSNTWQLVINSTTTVVTFLMVFLIQKSQNKDSMAIQLKLNELVAANEKASNRLVNIEDITEEELVTLHKFYSRLAALAMKESDLHASHSIDEAEQMHQEKHSSRLGRKQKKSQPKNDNPNNSING